MSWLAVALVGVILVAVAFGAGQCMLRACSDGEKEGRGAHAPRPLPPPEEIAKLPPDGGPSSTA